MKSILVILVCGASVVVATGVVNHFWRGTTIASSKAKQKWGDQKFTAEEFRKATVKDRGRMTYDLFKHLDHFRGMRTPQIRTELGDPDGFYFRDTFPAYVIDDGDQEGWQIVFLLDNDFKVSNAIIHKNCCDQP